MKGFKKGVALTAAFAMAAASLTGCASTKAIDGTATVAICNEENISMGLAALYTRIQQAQTFNMYASYFGNTTQIMDMEVDQETGETYGDEIKMSALVDIESFYLLRQHAEEYNVALTDEELASIEEHAAAFMAANDADALAKTGITQEAMEELLNLYAHQIKMYAAMIADVDANVTDEEAKQSKVTYVRVGLDGNTDEEGNIVDLTEDELAAKKAQAEEILTDVLAAGVEADFDAIAKAVDSTLAATTSTYGADTATVDASILAAVEGLADGEIVDYVVESEDGKSLYIVRFDADMDREATDAQKATILSERQTEDFNTEIESWKEASDFTINQELWDSLKVNDTQIYDIYAEQAEGTEVTE